MLVDVENMCPRCQGRTAQTWEPKLLWHGALTGPNNDSQSVCQVFVQSREEREQRGGIEMEKNTYRREKPGQLPNMRHVSDMNKKMITQGHKIVE